MVSEHEFVMDTVIGVISETIDNLIINHCESYGQEAADKYIQTVDTLSQNYCPIAAYSDNNIQDHVGFVLSNSTLREVLFNVWTVLCLKIGPKTIQDVSLNFITAAKFINSKSKNDANLLSEEFCFDLPSENTLNQLIKNHPWLFIPGMIALFYNTAEAELRVAKKILSIHPELKKGAIDS